MFAAIRRHCLLKPAVELSNNPHIIMLSNKDYANMTLEELVSEEQKMKSQKITTAVFIGVLFGIAVYAATHKSFILPVALMAFAFMMGSRYSQNMKNIQTEISRRNTIQ